MTGLVLAIAAICLSLATGLVCLFVPAVRVQAAMSGGACLASVCALVSGAFMSAAGGTEQFSRYWSIPFIGPETVRGDPLSGFLLMLFGIVALPISLFSYRYLDGIARKYSLRAYALWYGVLLAGIMGILLAGDVLTFMVAWEAMAVTSTLLVGCEHERRKSIAAAWQMFIASEAGAAAFLAGFLLLSLHAHSLQFGVIENRSATLSGQMRIAVFLLSFFGFATKAGLVPVNFWLPKAHPAAPGPVSAILSAFILNCGLYGIFLVDVVLLPVHAVWCGVLVLAVGTVSAILGILYAAIHNDLKTVLAHSSIENVGLITIGIGAGMIFLATNHPLYAGLADTVALFQLANHSIFKSLLFLGASTVDRQARTRELDLLGGLSRAMPWTAGCMLIGALSISALPPFNGFTSEWLLIQTLLRSTALHSVTLSLVCAIAGIIVGLTAALSITCFVRIIAMGFLGHARSPKARDAMEAPWSMRAPMIALSALCIAIGVLPTLVLPVVARAIVSRNGAHSVIASLIPPFFAPPGHDGLSPAFQASFSNIGAAVGKGILPGSGMIILHQGGVSNPVVFATSPFYAAVTLCVLLGVTWGIVRICTRRHATAPGKAWAGGMSRILPEMTPTATAFARPVRVIFQAVVHPSPVHEEREAEHEHFRNSIRRADEDMHVLDDYVLKPLGRGFEWVGGLVTRMHGGKLTYYSGFLLLMLVAVIVIGLWK